MLGNALTTVISPIITSLNLHMDIGCNSGHIDLIGIKREGLLSLLLLLLGKKCSGVGHDEFLVE